MGLFDRFRKRVHEVAEETDDAALSVEEASQEAQALLNQPAAPEEEDWDDVSEIEAPIEGLSNTRTHVPAYKTQPDIGDGDDDWDTWDLSLIHI